MACYTGFWDCFIFIPHMAFSLTQIISHLIRYKYLVLFPAAIIEGPIITIIAGFLASLGYLNIFGAYALIVIGDLAGDSGYYCIGRWGRERFIDRWGGYLGITSARVERLEAHFQKHGGKTLASAKLIHVFSLASLIAAGIVRVPYRKFLWYILLPTMAKSLALLLVGFFFGSAYVTFDRYLTYISFTLPALIVILFMVYFVMKRTQLGQRFFGGL